METTIAGLRDVLAEEPCGREEEDEGDQASGDDADPVAGWCGRG
jgi:hypothetical protein